MNTTMVRTRITAAVVAAFTVFGLCVTVAPAAFADVTPPTLVQSVSTNQTKAATTLTQSGVRPSAAGQLLLAFLSSDGPSSGGSQSFKSVTGCGTWTLAKRANAQPGAAEIWQATSTGTASCTVTATRNSGSYQGSITVAVYSGASVGVSAGASGSSGAAAVALAGVQSNSAVRGVGSDWTSATGRTLLAGQTSVNQMLSSLGDTYWVQDVAPAVSPPASLTVGTSAPAGARQWNFAAVEVKGTGAPSPPPAAACGDGVDNDGDGKVDFPADPGCTDLSDTDETDPAPPSTTTPPPTSTTTPPPPPPAGAMPGPDNTGVPAGTVLDPYTGPCEIHADNVVIDSKTINCSIVTYNPGLIVRKSKVNGIVFVNAPAATVRVEDSEVDGGSAQWPSVGDRNATVIRSNVHGGQHAVQCYGNCLVQDSWLHDTYPGGKQLGWHENAFISNGGSNITVQHNTLFCTGGCTADLSLIPDDNLSTITVDGNLFQASPDSAYCLYGGGTTAGKSGTNDHIAITNNVVQYGANRLCASFGPVTSFNPGNPGNVWTNNTWEDGATIPAPSQ